MTDYLFNRVCSEPVYDRLAAAQVHLAAMLRGLAVLDTGDSEALPAFRCHEDPWLLPLVQLQPNGEMLSVGDVANSLYGTSDHDLATYFDSLSRMVPSDGDFTGDMEDAVLRLDPKEAVPGHEHCLPAVERSAFDLGLCVVSDSLLASLGRDPVWALDRIAFAVGGHAYFVDHVADATHAEVIAGRRRAGLYDDLTVRSFWALRSLVFPHLLFGLDVDAQIDHFGAKFLPLLFRRLADLDARARCWQACPDAGFPDGRPEITPESDQTMERYAERRVFRGHDGVRRTFEEHMWIDGLHRIHLIRHNDTRVVEIGYVGRHLPTVRHRT